MTDDFVKNYREIHLIKAQNWHDNLTDEQIAQLKENKIPLGLCDKWMQEAFKMIGIEDAKLLQRYNYPRSEWERFPILYIPVRETVVKLNPDWQRPEPEKVEEDKWQYCEVMLTAGDYSFMQGNAFRWFHERENIPGYGGIEFKERPGEWFMTHRLLTVTVPRYMADTEYLRCAEELVPATPKRVRFLRRESK